MSAQNDFSYNLKKIRQSLKLSQAELSEKIGITPKHLSEIERGKCNPSFDIIDRISIALDTPVYVLFISPKEEDFLFSPSALYTIYDKALEKTIQDLPKYVKKQVEIEIKQSTKSK